MRQVRQARDSPRGDSGSLPWRVPFRVPSRWQNRQTDANGRERRQKPEDARSLSRAVTLKTRAFIGVPRKASKNPTLSASLRETLATRAASAGRAGEPDREGRSAEASGEVSAWRRRTAVSAIGSRLRYAHSATASRPSRSGISHDLCVAALTTRAPLSGSSTGGVPSARADSAAHTCAAASALTSMGVARSRLGVGLRGLVAVSAGIVTDVPSGSSPVELDAAATTFPEDRRPASPKKSKAYIGTC